MKIKLEDGWYIKNWKKESTDSKPGYMLMRPNNTYANHSRNLFYSKESKLDECYCKLCMKDPISDHKIPKNIVDKWILFVRSLE